MEHQIDVWAACVDRAVLCSSGSRVSLKAELPQFIMFQLEGWGVMGHHVAPHPAPWKWRSHEHFPSQEPGCLDSRRPVPSLRILSGLLAVSAPLGGEAQCSLEESVSPPTTCLASHSGGKGCGHEVAGGRVTGLNCVWL